MEARQGQDTQELEAMLEQARRQLHHIRQAIDKLTVEGDTIMQHITFLQQQLDRQHIALAGPPRQSPNRRSHVLASRRDVSRSENDLAAARRQLDSAETL